MSSSPNYLYVATALKSKMNLSRYSKQLFPLILGNSRTAFLMSNVRTISTSPLLSKEENEINLGTNPYYLKYADKIKKLKETNPTEYFKRIEAIKKASMTPENAVMSEKESKNEKEIAKTPSYTQRKGLDSLVKLELLIEKSASEITQLWKEYYKDKEAVYAVIPSHTFQIFSVLIQSNPMFIYPIPRKDGYEMFLGQFSGNDCKFTSLMQFQKHGENAPVQFVICHFTELQESKGIVLMSGDVHDEGINVTDAQLLSYQMQYFYNDDNYQMVKDFNQRPQEFDYNKVIECVSNSLLLQHSKIK